MKCHVRLKMQKMLQKCKRCWLHQSDIFYQKNASRKMFLHTVDLEGEDVFLFTIKRRTILRNVAGIMFVQIGETDPVGPIFIFRLYGFCLKFQPSQKGTNLSFSCK